MSPPTTCCPQGHRLDALDAAEGVCRICGEPIGTPTTPVPAAVDVAEPYGVCAGGVPEGATLFVPQCSSAPTVVSHDAARSFTIIQMHGMGGHGIVCLARDHVLERTVAIKQIRGAQASHPQVRARFIREARITGQLAHPGIVPIYGLEFDAAGDPFLVMKFVEGRTLKEAIAAYHRAPSSAGLAELLRRFENVCQTLAYAHSKGVVHRDLKPANIMLGDFGETLVLDWGLAKRLMSAVPTGEPDSLSLDPVPVGHPEAPLSAPHTSSGRAFGTPGFMAPEIARGETSDERADVWGLGAILCQILTDKPPIVADTIGAVVEKTAAGALGEGAQRLQGCGAEPELIALALACLVPDTEQRLRHAGLVAERLSRYLASVQERLQAAEVARAEAQARASEEYKRRRLTALLGAALILLLAAVTLGWHWYEKRQAERRLGAEMALRQGESLFQTGHLDKAEVTWQGGLNLANDLVGARALSSALEERMRLVQRAQQAHKLHELTTLLHFYSVEDFLPLRGWYVLDAGCRYFWQQRDLLAQPGNLPRLEQKLEQRLREDLLSVAVLWGDLQVRRAGPGQRGAAQRAALTVLAEAEALFGPNVVLFEERARQAHALGFAAVAQEATDQARERAPRTVWEHYGAGRAHLLRAELAEAAQALQHALDLQPDDFAAHFLSGVVAYRRGRPAEALSAFSFCLGQEPKAEGYYYRGRAAAALEQFDQARRDFDLALQKKPAFGPAYLQRGLLHAQQQRWDAAAADLSKALQHEADPAATHWHLARIHCAQNNLPEARMHLQQALQLQPDHAEALQLHKQLSLP